jgi:hypothetical protein
MTFDKILKDPSKYMFSIISAIGVIVLIVVLIRYNKGKGAKSDGLSNPLRGTSLVEDISANAVGPGGDLPGASTLDEESYLQVQGINTTVPVGQSCNGQASVNPSDLLPKDINSEWASVNPASNDLKNLNLLSATQVIGLNTIGSSLRNANYQYRSDPPIPKQNVGVWNNSTIDSDNTRRQFEIGMD